MFKPLFFITSVSIAIWSNTHLASANSLNSSTIVALAAVQEIERVTVRGAYFGQENADGLKTPTVLINVPQSLSMVSAEQIQQQGFDSIADILQYTPGASVGQGEGHRDQMTIRGQNTTADFFIDGLRDDVQYFRPLYNLERVEILRGANALLFGRGGGGGIVNRVTKTATLNESFTALSAAFDTFAGRQISIDRNQQLDANQAFRLNAFYEQLDNHRDNYDGQRFAINPTYTNNVNDTTQLVLSYEYVDDDRAVDRGIPSLNDGPLIGQSDTFFGHPTLNFSTIQAHVLRAKLDHQWSENWSVNGTLQYSDYDKMYQNIYSADFDGLANAVTLDGYRDATQRQNIITQFNAVGQFDTASVEHTVLVGAEYGQQDSANNRRDSLFADSNNDQITLNFTNPLLIPEVGFTDFVRDSRSQVHFSSIFVQDEMRLNPSIILVAGLRYDRFDIDVKDQLEIANGPEDGNNGLLGRVDAEVSPRFGAIYKPNEELSFYLSLSRSFLPRSGDQFLSLSLSTQALAPEEFENRELGLKWNISNKLSFSAALFDVRRENGTASDPTDPEKSLIIGTKTTGVELQLSGYITDDWQINAGYSQLDAKETGRVVNDTINNRLLDQIPDTMFTLWNRYRLNEAWALGLGIIYQAEQYTSLNNSVTLPDFTRVDAAVYYTLSENTKLQFNIENVFDEEYFPAAHNDHNISTGGPINARVGLTYQF
jgi:catecholate siderophore receptor